MYKLSLLPPIQFYSSWLELVELKHCDTFYLSTLNSRLKTLERLAEECGFEATLVPLKDLLNCLPSSLRLEDDVPVTEENLKHVQSRLSAMRANFQDDAAKTSVAFLDQSVVSDRFSKLDRSILSESGCLFYDETVKCLQIGAYRATIVNAWSLCIDFLRNWILNDDQMLAEFNAKLTTGYIRKKDKQPVYTEINCLEEFWEGNAPGERIFIDCAFDLLGEKLHRRLLTALDERNTFAHANSESLEAEKTNGYISSILDILQDKKPA